MIILIVTIEIPVIIVIESCCETGEADAKKLSKLQRTAAGGAGALLAAGGLGGLAWLHWPVLGPSGLCAVAGGCGSALLALAAKGELQRPARKASKAKPLLELKLIDTESLLKGELEALAKLEAPRSWPKKVELALKAADEAARQARQERTKDIVAIFYPFSQFCEINISYYYY